MPPRARGPVAAAAARATTLVTGAAITSDALRYAGQGYAYGGPADHPGNWDCSSFVSYVLGHDLGMGLPGGRWGDPGYPPHAHGPVVESYASWSGATAVTSPQPGDLVLWIGSGTAGHIGLVLGPDKMVSALNTSSGTLVSPIQGYGPTGASPVYRRLTGAGGGISTTSAPGGKSALAAMVLAAAVVGVMTAAIIGAAVLAGMGVTAAAAWAGRKAMTHG